MASDSSGGTGSARIGSFVMFGVLCVISGLSEVVCEVDNPSISPSASKPGISPGSSFLLKEIFLDTFIFLIPYPSTSPLSTLLQIQ